MTPLSCLAEIFDAAGFTSEPLRIADVGANPLGEAVYDNLLDADLAEVWGFEPHPEAFAALKPGLGRHWINAAVGKAGPAKFYAYPASEMSSLYPLSRRNLNVLGHFKRHLGTETVMDVELQALDDLDDLPRLDCLKIDAQGAELQVIQGGEDRLSEAVAVVAEMRFFELYDGEPALGDLDLELRRQGFVLHKFLHQKPRMIGHSQRKSVNARAISSQLIDGDVVYIRSLMAEEQYSDHQLVRLAFLAADIFESHDLVLFCLDRLVERDKIVKTAAQQYVKTLPARLRA